jgi:lipoate-protein ligase B
VGSTPDEPAAAPLRIEWRGRQRFADCLEDQLRLRDGISAGDQPETLILVEHPPTLTLGRRASREDILWDAAQLERAGMAVCETPRGGELTLHAPGQLVCYPIVRVGRQIRRHIVDMAEATIEVVEELGVRDAEFRMEHPGVWVGSRKLASIGIHVSRGIAVQGLSLNVRTESHLFAALVSCGLPEVTMTTIEAETTGPVPSLDSLALRWADAFVARTGRRAEGTTPTANR